MLKTTEKAPINLEAMTGFDLLILGSEGQELDRVGMFAQDCHGYDRVQILMLSFARSLVYMFRFYSGKRRERGTYKAHLRDLERKLADFNKEID